MKRKISFAALAVAAALLLTLPAFAQSAEHCFESAEFSSRQDLDGIFLTKVPEKEQGSIYLGSRRLVAGDVVPKALLDTLRLKGDGDVTLVFCPVEGGRTAEPTALTVFLGKKEDLPPKAADSQFETYKNIPNTGRLSVEEPEGQEFSVTLVQEPKRGAVEFDGGSFTYTPLENKVGKDKFTYTVTDPAGNTSGEATVTVQILKPSVKGAYADMQGDGDEYAAMWLKENDLFTGEQVAGHLCFCPDKAVTRGEFLTMTMKLVGKEASAEALSTGFADEKNTPAWMQPYLVTALRAGMISGDSGESGTVFRPNAALTTAEAAVMLQNTLQLPGGDDTAVFYSDAVPAWAQSSYKALACAGIDLSPEQGILNRRDAARLLCAVGSMM